MNKENEFKTLAKNSDIKSNNLKPIFSYLHFLNLYILKKPSTWIFLILTWSLIFILTLIPSFSFGSGAQYISNNNGDQIINPDQILLTNIISILIFSIVVFLSSTCGILKFMNVFVDGQDEGIELLIISKPINRTQVILTRFIFIFIFSLIFSLVNFLMFLFGSLIVGTELFKNYSNILVGVLFGSLLSFTILGLLGALLGIKFSGKIARVFTMGVFSISYIFYMVSSQIGPFLLSNPVRATIETVNNKNGPNYEILKTYESEKILNYIIPSIGNSINEITEAEKKILINAFNENKNTGAGIASISYLNLVSALFNITGQDSSILSFGDGSISTLPANYKYELNWGIPQELKERLWNINSNSASQNYYVISSFNSYNYYFLNENYGLNDRLNTDKILQKIFPILIQYFLNGNINEQEALLNAINGAINELSLAEPSEDLKFITDNKEIFVYDALVNLTQFFFNKRFSNEQTIYYSGMGVNNEDYYSRFLISLNQNNDKTLTKLELDKNINKYELDNNTIFKNIMNNLIKSNANKDNYLLEFEYNNKNFSLSSSIGYLTQAVEEEFNPYFTQLYSYDPQWAVALTWTGITLIIAASVVVLYYRKDFK
ncbi:MAG: hypothetical protein ACRCRZ_01000 [Metamycoplasmataceae bacterium]